MKASLSDFTDNLSEKLLQKSVMNVELQVKIVKILTKKGEEKTRNNEKNVCLEVMIMIPVNLLIFVKKLKSTIGILNVILTM